MRSKTHDYNSYIPVIYPAILRNPIEVGDQHSTTIIASLPFTTTRLSSSLCQSLLTASSPDASTIWWRCQHLPAIVIGTFKWHAIVISSGFQTCHILKPAAQEVLQRFPRPMAPWKVANPQLPSVAHWWLSSVVESQIFTLRSWEAVSKL